MTYEEHQDAIEDAAVQLCRAVDDAYNDNVQFLIWVERGPMLELDKQFYLAYVQDPTPIEDFKAVEDEVIQRHHSSLKDIAENLALALTQALRDHYAFEIITSPGVHAITAASSIDVRRGRPRGWEEKYGL